MQARPGEECPAVHPQIGLHGQRPVLPGLNSQSEEGCLLIPPPAPLGAGEGCLPSLPCFPPGPSAPTGGCPGGPARSPSPSLGLEPPGPPASPQALLREPEAGPHPDRIPKTTPPTPPYPTPRPRLTLTTPHAPKLLWSQLLPCSPAPPIPGCTPCVLGIPAAASLPSLGRGGLPWRLGSLGTGPEERGGLCAGAPPPTSDRTAGP